MAATKKDSPLTQFSSLSLEVVKAKQAIEYREVLTLKEFKLRLEMKSDSYKKQCYARISVWNGKEWSFLDSIHYSLLSFKDGLISVPHNQPINVPTEKTHEQNVGYFIKDRNILLNRAYNILA